MVQVPRVGARRAPGQVQDVLVRVELAVVHEPALDRLTTTVSYCSQVVVLR